MRLFNYKINLTVEKIPKRTAEGIFQRMEYHQRDRGEKTPQLYFKVSNKMFEEIQRLAREDYEYHVEVEEDRIDSNGEKETSFYRFEIVNKHSLGYVTFTF